MEALVCRVVCVCCECRVVCMHVGHVSDLRACPWRLISVEFIYECCSRALRVLRYMSKISATGAPGESPKESPVVIAPSAEGDGAGGSSDQLPDYIYDSSDWEEPEESIEDSNIHERVFNPEPGTNVGRPTANELLSSVLPVN